MTGRGLVASVLGLCALSCGAVEPGEAIGSQAEPIIAGEPSGAEQDGVVLLRTVLEDNSELLCSASLVGPNLIMTARHCVAYLTDGPFSCSPSGELIDNPSGGGRLGLDRPAASLEIYGGRTPRRSPLAHGLQVISTLPPTICENDLAFVVLDTALDLPLVPLRLGRPAELHEPAVLVGYGTSQNAQLINYKTQARQQKRGLEVAGVGPDSIDDGVTTVPPRTLFLDGPSGCIGDSGGPLLAESSGAVLGIYSLQRGSLCSAPHVRSQLVHVPPFQTLIDQAFAAAGCEPVPEPTPEAGGEAEGAGAASGAPNAAAGNESSSLSGATGGVGGAAGETAPEPEPKPKSKTAKSSGCSLSSPRRDADAAPSFFLLALGAIALRGRRRRLRQPSSARRRSLKAY